MPGQAADVWTFGVVQAGQQGVQSRVALAPDDSLARPARSVLLIQGRALAGLLIQGRGLGWAAAPPSRAGFQS
jgi:hypothetical protein